MAYPEDEKDEERRSSSDDLPTFDGTPDPTTPYGTPVPSKPAGEPYLTERALRDIAQRFELLGELGRGGMGIVYRARDRETSEIVALKILKPEIATRPDLIERFKTELRLARKITHKNVCRSYDLHRFGDTVVIAMEYVEGESLRAVLNRPGGVSLRGGLRWASQICAALAEAHTQGIVHRDLKPENIVIDSSGQAKVMDFGIARSIDTATVTGVITGTAAYMSPEQAEGKPADARSDIYSLGLIFYEMFTGQQGLKAESPIALVHKQIHETPTPPREVEPYLPPFLDRTIRRCLEKNPKQRFQSVMELDAAITETPETKAPTTGGAEITLPPHLAFWQRSDWALLVGAVFAAALFLVLFYRYHPASVMEFNFSEEKQKQTIVEILKKLSIDAEPQKAELQFRSSKYYANASKRGIWETKLLLANERQFASWAGSLANSREGKKKSSGFYYMDTEGKLLNFYYMEDIEANLSVKLPLDAAALAEMKSVARKGLASVFGIEVSTKEPDAIYIPSGQNALGTAFMWKLPVDSGHFVRRYEASVDGLRIRGLFRDPGIYFNTNEDEPSQPPDRYVITPMLIIVFVIAVFFWQKVYKHEHSPQNLVVAVLVGLGLAAITGTEEFASPSEVPLKFILPAVTFCLGMLLTYATLNVVLYYLRARLPIQVSNYFSLWRHGLRARTSGLELLRGIFVGLVFGAAWMALLSVGGLWGKAFVGMISFAHTPFYESMKDSSHVVENLMFWSTSGRPGYWSSDLSGGLLRFYVLFILGEALLVPWLLVALPLSLLAKVNARVPVLILGLVGLWLGLGFSLAGAMAFPSVAYYIMAALQAVFFGLVFLRYGLLAASSAVLTVETFLLAFPLYTMLRNLYPLLLSAPFLVWFLVFLGAGAIYLQPRLATAYRRVTAVFE